ncbi:MAG: 2-phospho-L-lactate guanylyltransferase [Sphingomonadales bacterium]|nr:2-phospho-L-lactate guanylyltransferase [Sphingomonadales bacterium]
MTTWAVIPLRASPESKSRLAAVLDAPARAALVEAMLARVLDAARSARNVSRVCLLGTAPAALPADVTVLAEPGGGLNAAAASALAQVACSRVVIIHADLPQVTAQDLELLAAAPEGTIAIAPDRHGTGTNAISLPLPAAKGFSFAFGPDSFARHKAEADRLGLKLEEVHSQGLARDVDEPDDLADAADLLKEAG